MTVLILSKRILIDGEFVNGGVLVSDDGKISGIFRSQQEVDSWVYANQSEETFDFDNYVVMPGLIDSHVHINEPGRTDWEGFVTATKAAAAGGYTTIVDMPLNSIPPTTTVENLKTKQNAAEGKIYVDLAFWGGVIPGNENELQPMVKEGVVGFKCFLCPSGVPEFPNVNAEQVDIAFNKLTGTNAVYAFHAEMEPAKEIPADEEHPQKYVSYLNSKPPSMEVEAIKLVTDMAVKHNTVRTHIVHLSASEAIPLIQQSRLNGAKLTVESCHHYLGLNAEDIPDEHTEFKCSPPIRDEHNRELLWKGIVDGDINLVVSDHSPSTPGLKMLTYGKNHGSFLKAWGGIASVQFGLSLFWTNCQKYNLGFKDVVKLMIEGPAKLCGIDDRKGKIAVGYDADFCVWDPEDQYTITQDIIEFRNKANPYMGKQLQGVVHGTFVRGNRVYKTHERFQPPIGKFVLKAPEKQ